MQSIGGLDITPGLPKCISEKQAFILLNNEIDIYYDFREQTRWQTISNQSRMSCSADHTK